MRDPHRRTAAAGHRGQCGEAAEDAAGGSHISGHRLSAGPTMAAVSAAAPPWASLPRLQLALGIFALALVGLATAAPVLVVVFGALDGNAWWQTFVESAVNRSAIGYSFLLALRAPIAALIGFLIAWLLIRIRLPGGRFIEFALWVTFFIPLLPVTLSWILLLNP